MTHPGMLTFLLVTATLVPQESPLPLDRPRVITIAPDDSQIAAGYVGGRVELLDSRTGELLRILEPHLDDDVWALEFSPNQRRLAALGHDGSLIVWDLRKDRASSPVVAVCPSGEHLRNYPFGSLLSWSPTGDRLVAGDLNGNNSLWTANGKLVAIWNVSDPVGDPQLLWTPDGASLLSADGKVVRILNAETGELLARKIECEAEIVALAIHPRGKRIATGHINSKLDTWNLETGELILEEQYLEPRFSEEEDEVAAISFSPDGGLMGISLRQGTAVFVVETDSRKRIWTSKYLGAHFFEVMQLAWSPDGCRFWFSFECGRGRLYCFAPSTLADPEIIYKSRIPRFGTHLGVVLEKETGVVSTAGDRIR